MSEFCVFSGLNFGFKVKLSEFWSIKVDILVLRLKFVSILVFSGLNFGFKVKLSDFWLIMVKILVLR